MRVIVPSLANNAQYSMPKGTTHKRKKQPVRKNNTAKPSRSRHFVDNIRNTARQDSVRFLVGLVLLFATLFCFIACVSYFFTASSDQSIVAGHGVSASELEKGEVQNTFSWLGAIVSHALVDGFLGVGIFALLVFPLMVSLKLIGAHPKVQLLKVFVKYTFFAITLSLLAYLVTLPFVSSYTTFRWGGRDGELLGEWLAMYIGVWGVAFLGLLLVVITWVLFRPRRKANVRHALSFNWLKWHRKPKDKADVIEPTEKNSHEQEFTTETTSEPPVGDFQETSTKATPLEDNNVEEVDPSEEYLSPQKEPSNIYATESKLVVEVAEGDSQPMSEKQFVKRDQGDLPGYLFPTPDLLEKDSEELVPPDMKEIRANEQLIIDTLESFKIKVTPIKATVGPTVTLYEIEPDAGIKISRIRNLEDDIALSLKADGIRIIAPIPGKGTIGIEVPNAKPRVVGLRSMLTSRKFVESKFELPIALGRTITNDIFTFDLTKMPHLLIAGATGQGKSVGMNVIITSLLYAKHPSELKFVMIDPKILEFSIYNDLQHHFFAKIPTENKCIITDTDRVIPTLLSLCEEMDNRYLRLTNAKVRNIAEYNKAYKAGELLEEDGHELMPYIVLVVDEFADLIMTGGKEIERPIARLAQKARAAGIHMILATQRPTTDVVTGTIKANFPARIAFKVFSSMDSRTILDSTGANRLIGRGDMLFYQGREMIRLQCALVDTPETQRIVDFIAAQPGYEAPYPLPEVHEEESTESSISTDKLDALFETVARAVVSSGQGSTSKIQRDFEIGFNRAGRLMDQLERAGIVGKQSGSKPREVLVQDLDSLNKILYNLRLSSK